MASEDTLIGNELVLAIGDGNSPETFTDFCAIGDVSGLGETKPQVDVTTLCDLARTFRNGLKEGNEMSLAVNLIQGDAQTRALFESYQADEIVNFRYRMRDVSPAEYFAFSATILSWNIAGAIGEKATMTFGLKISGVVDWVYT
jgi:hypothetical protein